MEEGTVRDTCASTWFSNTTSLAGACLRIAVGTTKLAITHTPASSNAHAS